MNKVALVVGVQRAELLARARALAQQGMYVVVASGDWSRAIDAALRLQLEGFGAEALHLQRDDAAALAEARQSIVRRRGRLDLVVDAGTAPA